MRATSTTQASPRALRTSAASRNASDVLLIVGAPAMLRINGVLATGGAGALEPEDVRSLVLPLLESGQLEESQKKKTVDLHDFTFIAEAMAEFFQASAPYLWSFRQTLTRKLARRAGRRNIKRSHGTEGRFVLVTLISCGYIYNIREKNGQESG